jgi:leucyl-tRNA synthetase
MEDRRQPKNHPLYNDYNKTVEIVTEDLERFSFNTAVARMMEFFRILENHVQPDHSKPIPALIIRNAIIMLAPFAPHHAEEWWRFTGSTESVFDQKWPLPVPVREPEKPVQMAVTVDGKVRGTITVDPAADNTSISETAKKHPNTARFLRDRTILKEIIIPGKIINFVLKNN